MIFSNFLCSPRRCVDFPFYFRSPQIYSFYFVNPTEIIETLSCCKMIFSKIYFALDVHRQRFVQASQVSMCIFVLIRRNCLIDVRLSGNEKMFSFSGTIMFLQMLLSQRHVADKEIMHELLRPDIFREINATVRGRRAKIKETVYTTRGLCQLFFPA